MSSRKKGPCQKERKIFPAAEERTNPNLLQPCYRLLRQLEEHTKTPLELRNDVVEDVLPENVYDFVKDIVPLKKFDTTHIEFLQPIESYELERSHSLDTLEDYVKTSKKKTQKFVDENDVEEMGEEGEKDEQAEEENDKKEEKLPRLGWSIESLGGDYNSKVKQKTVEDEKLSKHKNPYIKFIKKNYDEACIWREKLPVDFSDKPLVEKAYNITDKIVNDFCQWLRSLGGSAEDGTRLNEKALHQMFHVGADNRDLKPISVQVKELISVPPAIAEALKKPQMGTRNTLLRHLKHDMNEEKRKKKLIAFGTCLPPRLRKAPSLNKTRLKWAESHKRIEDIDTMERVWVDILHLRSTVGYCEFLKEDTTKKRLRPPYLEKSGCFEYVPKEEEMI